MKFAARIPVLVLLVVLTGCASAPPAEATPSASPNQLVGSWRMDSVAEGPTGKPRPVTAAAFMQFYPDGTMASWSAAEMGDVAQGRYRIKEGRLTLTPVSKSGLVFGVTGDTWWYEKENGERCFYHRVRPDPMPGRLP